MTGLVTNRQERIRFYKFMVVGVIGAVVDFGVMNFLAHVFNASLTLAGSISFICAVVSNFFWNRYWTYPDSRSRPLAKQLVMFFIVNVAGIAIRIPILHFVEPPLLSMFEKLEFSFAGPEIFSRNITLAIAVGVVMLWNFFANRYWTYNDVDKVTA
ncbi:MAG: GtrA family protein [Chloroflexi bacterium]|nr:GtrA family protein [Chloroflexota bacterium]